jgi:membrane-bound metal-dependent hydrolase YbcI (DUF457 family)
VPSSVAHALTAVALGTVFFPAERSRRLYTLAAAGAVLLDVDAIGRPFGLGDVAWLGGHRALTHSLVVAVAAAALLAGLTARERAGQGLRMWAYFALALAAHGALDALTAHGEGVMFLAPFSLDRFRCPWQPLDGLWPEVFGIWVPAIAAIWFRRREAAVSIRERVP